MWNTYRRLRGFVVIGMLLHHTTGQTLCQNWWDLDTVEGHTPEENCSLIWTQCFSSYNATSETKDQFLAICRMVASFTLGCQQDQEPADRCVNMACYRSLGRLYHETLLLATGNSSTNQAVMKLFGPTLLRCQQNATAYNDKDIPNHQMFHYWERYIFIMCVPFAFVLGLGIILLCFWVRWLRRHKRLCFAEKEEPCTGKWEGASQQVTLKILQKHNSSNSGSCDKVASLPADEKKQICAEQNVLLQEPRLDVNMVMDDPQVTRLDDKREERAEGNLSRSSIYEVSRDSVASEFVCYSLSNENFGKADFSTEQTIE